MTQKEREAMQMRISKLKVEQRIAKVGGYQQKAEAIGVLVQKLTQQLPLRYRGRGITLT